MTKIQLDRNGDYTPLSVEQVRALFGCTSAEYKASKGLEICLAVRQGDRGAFRIVVRAYNEDCSQVAGEYENNITLGDDQIEQYIDISKPSESRHSGYVSLRQEYRDQGVSLKDFI